MNALEQECADNVRRAARREKIRIAALIVAGLGAASGVAALAGHAAWILPGLGLAGWTIVDEYFRYAPRIVPEPADDPPQVECGYRDAMVSTQPETEQVKQTASPALTFAVLAFVSLGAMILLIALHDGRWSEHSQSAVVRVGLIFVVFVSMLVKCGYDAWKKRHDAKLMIEWERRLEEKG